MKDPLFCSIINSYPPYPALARAWVRKALGSGVSNYIIFCADDESFNALSREGITVRRIKGEDYDVPPQYSNSRRKFGQIPFLKLVIVEQLLAEGFPVVYSDVDAFIQENPSQLMKKLFGDNDVLLSTVNHPKAYPLGARRRWGFSLCSGWFALKGSAASSKFIQDLKKSKGTDLQLNFNQYVMEHATLKKGDDQASFEIDGVRFKLLDQSFVSRSEFPIDSYVYHCLRSPSQCLGWARRFLSEDKIETPEP